MSNDRHARTAWLRLRLGRLGPSATPGREFHVRRDARDEFALADSFFSIRGDVVFADHYQAHVFADAFNRKLGLPEASALRPAQVHAMGLIHEIYHAVLAAYRQRVKSTAFGELVGVLGAQLGDSFRKTLLAFVETFPPSQVYRRERTAAEFLAGATEGVSNVQWVVEEILLLWLANENPGYAPIKRLIGDEPLRTTAYPAVLSAMREYFDHQAPFGPGGRGLIDMLLAPIRHSPSSLMGQLDYMRMHWGLELSGLDSWRRLLGGMDFVREEGKWFQRKSHGVGAEDALTPPRFKGELYESEPEAFSPDLDWMPNVVLLAKSTYVWLDQLAKRHGRPIRLLSEIPNEELDTLAARGFTGLWLIGLWRRSLASARIKQLSGNRDAVASAYSLWDYEIEPELGGYDAYIDLKRRAARRGIRLASDMVPNHMGVDSPWVVQHPDWFVQSDRPPFPNYTYTGPDLSSDEHVGIFIEDGYWSRRDAAVTFKRVDRGTGSARYVYHGNDGTSMPWNDTAQLDYLKAEVREAVIQQILRVARMFPIIRFDAAMTLAKRHYQRLWFPLPGQGGDIPSRAQHALTREQFDAAFPVEFWREVVDRIAAEVPDTLLLAEAFWLMEGYFVRTLGMHRVYNSAFMNMFKREENASYRTTIRNVLEFNPQVLKRFVNFMNNPDEETAAAQFGRDDKYFGVCIVMCTMPGLPMFGHGQVEGFTEKYGMEFRRAMREEQPDPWLVARHEREIFPLLKRRWLFSDVEAFFLYDFVTPEGWVDEDVFAYSNRKGGERALVVYHNKFKHARGSVRTSVGYLDASSGRVERRSFGDGLAVRAEPGLHTVFRDLVTGLEYLRSNRELREGGLALELGAFKYHVFVDFREVVDGPGAPWSELARALGGRGVSSIDDALVEHAFRPVHAPFWEAVAPGSVAFLSQGLDEATSEPKADVARAAVRKVEDMAAGLAYMKGPFPVPAELPGRVRARHAAALRVLAEPPTTTAAPVLAATSSSAPPAPAATARPGLAPPHVAFAWVYTSALLDLGLAAAPASSPRSLFEEWFLERVLRRSFVEGGLGPEDASRGVRLVRFLAQSMVGKAPAGGARALLARLLAEPAVPELLRTNVFQGVTWFNKEAWEEIAGAVGVVAAVDALASDAAAGSVARAELDAAREAASLGEQAGYRLEALRVLVAEPPPEKPAAPASPRA
jgi:glycosidase